ncbi:hypothetical protein FF1_009393 [Malus domestica]
MRNTQSVSSTAVTLHLMMMMTQLWQLDIVFHHKKLKILWMFHHFPPLSFSLYKPITAVILSALNPSGIKTRPLSLCVSLTGGSMEIPSGAKAGLQRGGALPIGKDSHLIHTVCQHISAVRLPF